MLEERGDLFKQACDAICLTTNGDVNRAGEAVMGRGIAAAAKRTWPGIEHWLGTRIAQEGNHVTLLTWGPPGKRLLFLPHLNKSLTVPFHIFSFPVKHRWNQFADRDLIVRSAKELVTQVDSMKLMHVCLVRPGCGNGGLAWASVKPLIAPLLDDRFVVVER